MQDEPAHDAGVRRPGDDHDRDRRVLEAAAEHRRDDHRQDDRREGEHEVGAAHAEAVERAAEVARDRADDRADRRGEQDDEQAIGSVTRAP